MSFLCKSTAWIKCERRPSVCVVMKRMSKVASYVNARSRELQYQNIAKAHSVINAITEQRLKKSLIPLCELPTI